MDVFALAAFSHNILLNGRWLLGGTPKDAKARQSHAWSTLLTVSEQKQELFVERILFIHELAVRRGAKSMATLRLSLSDWDLECDRFCVLGAALGHMEAALDDKGERLFSNDLIDALCRRAIEGILGSFTCKSNCYNRLFASVYTFVRGMSPQPLTAQSAWDSSTH